MTTRPPWKNKSVGPVPSLQLGSELRACGLSWGEHLTQEPGPSPAILRTQARAVRELPVGSAFPPWSLPQKVTLACVYMYVYLATLLPGLQSWAPVTAVGFSLPAYSCPSRCCCLRPSEALPPQYGYYLAVTLVVSEEAVRQEPHVSHPVYCKSAAEECEGHGGSVWLDPLEWQARTESTTNRWQVTERCDVSQPTGSNPNRKA